MNVIEAKDLFFSYGNDPIFSNISFEVEGGEFMGIIGPNGGGKSTLLRLILGFLTPDKGSLNVFGKGAGRARHQMAYVPQNMRFDKHFPISVLDLVLQGRLFHLPWYGIWKQHDMKKAILALEQVNLAHLQDRPFGTLSGGEQQRALIARALVSDPKILVLDEPTANVDHAAEKTILELLSSLKSKMTILLVTHDLQTAIDRVSRILCVQREVVSYSPKEICEHYALGLYHPPLLTVGGK
jgi:zinc transport system ATP-binding protein